MKVETLELRQKAVLWPFVSYDRKGQPIVSAPIEISCRWRKGRSQSIGDNNAPIALDGRAVVDRDIALSSLMWFGQLADLPDEPTDIHEVMGFDSVPDIKCRESRRSVKLRRWKSVLPTIV